jgi:hypothetical protein
MDTGIGAINEEEEGAVGYLVNKDTEKVLSVFKVETIDFKMLKDIKQRLFDFVDLKIEKLTSD